MPHTTISQRDGPQRVFSKLIMVVRLMIENILTHNNKLGNGSYLYAVGTAMARPTPSSRVCLSARDGTLRCTCRIAPFVSHVDGSHTSGNVPKDPESTAWGTSWCLGWEGGTEPHS